jgi:hypothetical protein
MCELLWVEEVFVVTEIPNDVFNILDKISEYLDICLDLLFADVEVSLVLASQMLNVFGSLVNIVVHTKSTGLYSVPSASRSAPSCLHTFSSAA